MTLLYHDSFDHYASADLPLKWTGVLGAGGNLTVGAYGRNGTNGLRVVNNTSGVRYALGTPAKFTLGFSFQIDAITAGSVLLVAARDTGTLQCEVRANLDGTLTLTRNGTTIATIPGWTYQLGTRYFFEWGCTIADSAAAGTCKVKINGVEVYSNSGAIDTKNTANAYATEVVLGHYIGGAGTVTTLYEDVYIEDGTDATASQGAPFNDFLGDWSSLYKQPASDVAVAFTRSGTGVTTNTGAVNQAAPDGDTTYNASSTPGQEDEFAVEPVATTLTIKALTVVVSARKDDAGSRTIKLFVKPSGGSKAYSPAFGLGDTYTFYRYTWGVNPATGSAWTAAEYNAATIGYRLES